MTFPAIPTYPGPPQEAVLLVNTQTTSPRSLPNVGAISSNIAVGDLLIVIVCGYQSSATANAVWSNWPSGWTEFMDLSSPTGMCVGAAYRFATGSDTMTSVSQAATITGHFCAILLCIKGAHASTPPEASSTLNQGTTSLVPIPGIVPSWGADDNLFIAIGANGETATTGSFTGVTAAPAGGFSDFLATSISADVVGGMNLAVAFLQSTTGNLTSGFNFTADSSNARNCAGMIAVRPAAAVYTAQPTAIDTAEAFGTPTIKIDTPVSPTAIASAEAFGTVTIAQPGAGTTVVPTGIATAEAFGTVTELATYTAVPNGIASAEAFGTVTQTNALTAIATAIASLEAFGTTVINKTITIVPTGIATGEVFGTATITSILTAIATAIVSAEAFGTPSVAWAIVAVPNGIATGEAFGTVTVSSGGTFVTLTGISSAEAFGTTTVTGALIVIVSGIASGEAFGTATILKVLTAVLSGIASAEAFGTATINKTITVIATGIATGEAFGVPTASTIFAVSPTAIGSAEAFGTPTITWAIVAIPTGIATAEAFGTVAIGNIRITNPDPIASLEAFGTPTLGLGFYVQPVGIVSAEAFGAVSTSGSLLVLPTGIISGQAFGNFAGVKVDNYVSPLSIAGAEAFGLPTWILGEVEGNLVLVATLGGRRYRGNTDTARSLTAALGPRRYT